MAIGSPDKSIGKWPTCSPDARLSWVVQYLSVPHDERQLSRTVNRQSDPTDAERPEAEVHQSSDIRPGKQSITWAMGYLSIKPNFPLSLFIRSVWTADNGLDARPTEWVLPSGSTSVVINISHGFSTIYDKTGLAINTRPSGAFVISALSEAHVIAPVIGEVVCGFEFTLGGSFALLGDELQELDGSIHELRATVVPWHQEHLDTLREASTPVQRLELLCAHLGQLLNFDHTISPTLLAATEAIDTDHNIRVKDLAATLGITARRLQRVFFEGLGTTPKKYARTQRFHWLIENVRSHRGDIDWVTLAFSGGFSDQSHLNHECQFVLGVTPSVLRRQVRLSGHPHHITLP